MSPIIGSVMAHSIKPSISMVYRLRSWRLYPGYQVLMKMLVVAHCLYVPTHFKPKLDKHRPKAIFAIEILALRRSEFLSRLTKTVVQSLVEH